MNKLLNILVLSILLVISINTIFAEEIYTPIQCSPELQHDLALIQKLPEAKSLIASIQQEGPIKIIAKNTHLSNTFGAYWDPDQREICIAIGPGITTGSIIGSILFELHNAYVNSKIDYFDQLAMRGEIDQAHYVQEMEYLEYLNSLNAASLAQKGIDKGIFPQDAYLHTYRNFQEHFNAQKMSGHSSCFEHNYQLLTTP